MQEIFTQGLTKKICDLGYFQALPSFISESPRECFECHCQLIISRVSIAIDSHLSKQLNSLEDLLASWWWLGNNRFHLFLFLWFSNLCKIPCQVGCYALYGSIL